MTDGTDRGQWNRSVTALLLSAFCTSTAALIAVTSLGKQVYDLTERELDLGLLGLAEFAPAAVLVLVTGTVADRFDRRRVMGLSAAGEAACGLALAFYAGTDPTAVLPIYLLVLAFGVARAFIAPSSRSLPADIVTPHQLPWLVARYAIAWQSAMIVGPVLGGTLYAIDVRLPYLAMAALAATAAVSAQLIRLEPAAQARSDARTGRRPSGEGAASTRPTLHDAFEGLRFIRRQPILLGAISLDLFAVLFGGAVALLPAIAEDSLGVDAVGLGWLRAAGGIGAALVTVWLARRPITRHVGHRLLYAVALFGLVTIVLGLTRSFAVAFLAMAVLTGADAVSVFIRSTLVPLAVSSDMRGRVLAVENVFIGASNELGAFESGVAGELLGTSAAVVLGGAATMAIAAGWWALFPALRQVDTFDAVARDADPPPVAPPFGPGPPTAASAERAEPPSGD